jgi:hypothetical protein
MEMGAWSEQPTANDEALEWIANAVERPVIDAIRAALVRFLENKSDDVTKAEAEAAVALLLDLATNWATKRYVQFNFGDIASDQGLWDKAREVIIGLRSEKKWLEKWNSPEKKAGVLDQLLAEIDDARVRRDSKL